MNFVPCRKEAHRLTFGEEAHAPSHGATADLPDGTYTAGFRANHITLNRHNGDAVEFRCTVAATEITGSETFVHLHHGADRWVGLIHGVHPMTAGAQTSVFVDPAHVYIFDHTGRLAAPAPYAMAA
jgi:glycerol transport system ATP-binding protein